jgi:VanZ family protein
MLCGGLGGEVACCDMTENRFRIGVLLIYVIAIFALSSIPGLSAPGPRFLLKDKVAHVAEYALLGMLLFKGIGWGVSRSRMVTFGFLLAVGASVGALDEIYQSFIPGRAMDIRDWYADILGVSIGVGIIVFPPLGRRRLMPSWMPVERVEVEDRR